MNRTMLGVVLASVWASAAHAQAGGQVLLYGVVDVGVIADKTEGQSTRSGVDTNLWAPSRFGIRGQESLSTNTKAFFVLENGFAVDTGNAVQGGRLFGRSAYVGLEDQRLGEVRAGRSMTLSQLWAPVIASPFILGMGRNSAGTAFAFDDDSFGNGRVDNGIYYVSPSFGGFQAAAGYSFSIGNALPGTTATTEQPGARNNNRLTDVGVRYMNGPLMATAVYMRTQVAASATAQRNPSSFLAAASYDFGPLKAHLAFGALRNAQTEPSGRGIPNTGWLTGTRHNDNAYSLGVSVPLGNGELKAAYQRTTSSKISSYGVGYLYRLSKRTSLYAFLNDGDTRDFIRDQDVSRRQIAAGISHTF